MEEIVKIIKTRLNELKKECWTNKIRKNELENILNILEKQQKTPVAGTTDANIKALKIRFP